MTVLHLEWKGGTPALWGEGLPREAPAGFAPHSLSARSLLAAARRAMWYQDGFTGGRPGVVSLPTADGAPVPSYCAEIPAGAAPADWKVEQLFPVVPNVLMFLSDVKGRDFLPGIFLGESVLRAAALFRHAASLASRGRFLPDVGRDKEGRYRAVWRLAPSFSDIAQTDAPVRTDDDRLFLEYLADGIVRYSAMTTLTRRISPSERFETVHDAWLAALRSEDGFIPWSGVAEIEALAADIRTWKSSLEETPAERAALRFELVAPPTECGEWKVSLASVPRTRRRMLALGQATLLFPPLRSMRRADGCFSAVITRAEAETFAATAAGALAAAGYAVSVPQGMAGEHVTAVAEVSPLAESSPDAPVAARLTVRVDGEPVDEAEIEFLLEQNSPMVFFRDRWIEVDRNILREALRALRASSAKRMKLRDAIAFAAGIGRAGRLKVEELKAHGWLRGLIGGLKGEDRFAEVPVPAAFHGVLKPFQLRGFSWLVFLAKWGLGACLADDMGLGKTVQAIAYILHSRGAGRTPAALVVAPLTLLGNWSRELGRFAPSLKVLVHHGPNRPAGSSFSRAVASCDVVLTSYNLLVKDFGDFAGTGFSAVILDEAQAVKNPLTRASRAVRSIDAPVRIALTGTPLENSVNDVWSLEEFLNPGLLGERADFVRDFAQPIAGDSRGGAAKRLRRVLEPFVLRRLKTDPDIGLELGEKIETREYCPLTPEQRRLYEDELYSFRADSEAAGKDGGHGGSRRGRVLALLTHLKEICDTPALLGPVEASSGAAAEPGWGDSGKLARLYDLLESIFEAGEKALVFTQYAKMGAFMRDRLLERFGRRMPFLHGALEPKAREAEIAAFRSSKDPVAFILSLRAGGFGLNLTEATHVIHFDRWWNPAVENQATDRAHRIGQTRTVHVHTFICSGTVEDHVDRLLETKRELAEGLITSGESFLAGMSDAELEEIVALDGGSGASATDTEFSDNQRKECNDDQEYTDGMRGPGRSGRIGESGGEGGKMEG